MPNFPQIPPYFRKSTALGNALFGATYKFIHCRQPCTLMIIAGRFRRETFTLCGPCLSCIPTSTPIIIVNITKISANAKFSANASKICVFQDDPQNPAVAEIIVRGSGPKQYS